MAELERMPARRQEVERRRQPRDVAPEALGQLPQDRAHLGRRGERCDAGVEAFDALLDVREPLHVREELARLGGEHELQRRLLQPGGDRLRLGEPVERGVDLDGVEERRVVLEPAARRHALGIHAATPVGVVPPGAADADLAHGSRMPAMGRVFVTRALPFEALDRLRARHEIDEWPGDMPPSSDELRARAGEAEGLLSLVTDRIDAELLDACPRLRAIANMAVGTDNIDVEAAAARGIAVGNTPDVLTDATADLAFALLLALARRIPEGAARVRGGEWRTWEPAGDLGADLAGATLGIVGWGRIGQAVARRAEGFGMEVIHSSRSSGVSLDELLARADFVSLHTPLTPDTRHLIDAQALARMKPTALLINTARGGVVDQDALRAALHAGEIAGAALDVTH